MRALCRYTIPHFSSFYSPSITDYAHSATTYAQDHSATTYAQDHSATTYAQDHGATTCAQDHEELVEERGGSGNFYNSL